MNGEAWMWDSGMWWLLYSRTTASRHVCRRSGGAHRLWANFCKCNPHSFWTEIWGWDHVSPPKFTELFSDKIRPQIPNSISQVPFSLPSNCPICASVVTSSSHLSSLPIVLPGNPLPKSSVLLSCDRLGVLSCKWPECSPLKRPKQ